MPSRTRPESDSPAPGRRYVTLLFADLSGSTDLADAMEAEHYAALLAALRGIYQACIPAHGGVVVRAQGDGLLAMFGYPVTREDDGRQAVEAALQLHRRVAGLRMALPSGRRLSLHSGIHAGLVLIGSGHIELGRFELLGPVPNIAARLSDAAAPHQILVSEETLGPASRHFTTGLPWPLAVKGREAPILVYSVSAPAYPPVLSAGALRQRIAPFVGRQAELARLEALLAAALRGEPSSVAVAGAAGIGKTRLLDQLLQDAQRQGARVLRGYCERGLRAQPLQPFRLMLPGPDGPAPGKGAAAFARHFAALAAQQPLVLCIDDWQWADSASRQVLRALRRLESIRLLVLLSTRQVAPDELLVATAQTLVLEPLSDSEAALAIAERLPGADPFVAARIANDAGGNPLFIEELCHSAARGDGTPRGGRDSAAWLQQLIESRVQYLSEAQAELLRLAAVVGNVVPLWLLRQLGDAGADDAMVRALAEQDFVFPAESADELRFKHGLTRDVIYESVGLHARQQLHLRIAAALLDNALGDPESVLEALAYHYNAGGDDRRAADHAERAGDKALRESSLDRARAQYLAALAALDRQGLGAELARRWVGIVHKLGLVTVFDPTRSELALAQRALRLAERDGDAATLVRSRYWLSYIHYALGDTRQSLLHGEQALAEARVLGDGRLLMQIVATLGEEHTAAAQYAQGLTLLDQAIEAKRQHRSGRHTNTGLAYSLVCRAVVLGDRGLFAQAGEAFDEALQCVIDEVHEIAATAQGLRSAVLLWRGHWAAARAAAEESARICEATGSLSQLSVARSMIAFADWRLHGQPASLQAIVDATAWLQPRESGIFRSLNHGWLAEGLGEVGRRDEARQHAARALWRSRQRDLIGVAMSYRALARDAMPSRPLAARHYLQRAHWVAAQRESPHETAVTQWCEATLIADAHRARALALLDRALPAFERMDMDWHLAQAKALREAL